MSSNWQKYKLLLRKDFVLKIRNFPAIMFEFLVPIACCAILLLIRSFEGPTRVPMSKRFKEISLQQLRFNEFDEPALLHHLAYSPKNPVLDDLVNSVVRKLNLTNYDAFQNSQELNKHLVSHNYLAGIEFDDNLQDISVLPKDLSYALRFPNVLRAQAASSLTPTVWQTDEIFRSPWIVSPNSEDFLDTYYQEGFVVIQNAIFSSYWEGIASTSTTRKCYLQRLPIPTHYEDRIFDVLGSLLVLFTHISFIKFYLRIVRDITSRKKQQLESVVVVLGVGAGWLRLAWFLKNATIVIGIVTVLTMGNCYIDTSAGAILKASDCSVIWLFYLAFSISLIMFSAFLGVLLSKCSPAISVAIIVYILTILLHVFLEISDQDQLVPFHEKIILCLLANSSLRMGLRLILKLEKIGVGVQWGNFFDALDGNDVCLGYIVFMLLIDSCVYGLLAWYLRNVFPGHHGVRESWLFCFQKNYWQSGRDNMHRISIPEIPVDEAKYVEKPPPNHYPGIKIRGLTKCFARHKVAIQNLNLNIYENELTVLLGFKGSGKSTLMSLLAGIMTPTSGTAYIYNNDIRKNRNAARRSLGLCQQENILFHKLTLKEHIKFACHIKGCSRVEIAETVIRFTRALYLEAYLDLQAQYLSAERRRLLSVCLALVGRPQIVLLDEPTRDLDVVEQRTLWNFLTREKTNRIILLSTQSIHTATVFGERIAFMHNGVLKAFGSPFYLTKHLGVGYHLICTKSDHCNTNDLTDLLKQHMPSIRMESNEGTSVSYTLPDTHTSLFKNMLANLESNLAVLGITKFYISACNLEEIFMKLSNADRKTEIRNTDQLAQTPFSGIGPSETEYLWNQIRGMILKKFYSTRSNKYLLLAYFLFAIGSTILTLIVIFTNRNNTKYLQESPLLISSDSYEKLSILVFNYEQNNNSRRYAEAYDKILESKRNVNVDHTTTPIYLFFTEIWKNDLSRSKRNYILAASFLPNKAIAWYNDVARHAAPLSLSLAHNAILSEFNCQIVVTNKPYAAVVNTDLLKNKLLNICYYFGLFHGLSLSNISAILAMFCVRERVTGVKLLQFVSGMSVFLFWTVSFVWDLGLFLIMSLIASVLLWTSLRLDVLYLYEIGYLMIIFVFTGLSLIPLAYCFSFLHSTSSQGYMRLLLWNMVTGVIAIIILNEFENYQATQKLADVLKGMLLIFPVFAFISAVFRLGQINPNDADFTKETIGFQWHKDINIALLCMFFTGLLALVFLLIRDMGFLKYILEHLPLRGRRSSYLDVVPYNVDGDVIVQNYRINTQGLVGIVQKSLLIKTMTKTYGKRVHAVDRLCLAVNNNECFGLLGITETGKSTIMKILTGEIRMSRGHVWIKGIYLNTDCFQSYYRHIGYCPQNDALLEELTARELLTMFALLRRIATANVNAVIEAFANELNFHDSLGLRIRHCTVGTKRKINFTMAAIGKPALLLLDEPTRGMELDDKQLIWNAILRLKNEGSSILLTTSDLKECEAVCNRLAIILKGRIKCVGTYEHLRSKFTCGYLLYLQIGMNNPNPKQVSLKRGTSNIIVGVGIKSAIKHFMHNKFPGSALREEYGDYLVYYIPDLGIKWSEMFGILEEVKDKFQLANYTVTQSTLAEVYQYFSEMQRNINDEVLEFGYV